MLHPRNDRAWTLSAVRITISESAGWLPGNLLQARLSHEQPVWETRRFLLPERAGKEGAGRSRPLRWGLNRKEVAVPRHFEPVIKVLNAISGVGTLLCFCGLIALSFWMTIFGMAVLLLGKSWFLDRMVWLYDEMKDTHSEYGKWFY